MIFFCFFFGLVSSQAINDFAPLQLYKDRLQYFVDNRAGHFSTPFDEIVCPSVMNLFACDATRHVIALFIRVTGKSKALTLTHDGLYFDDTGSSTIQFPFLRTLNVSGNVYGQINVLPTTLKALHIRDCSVIFSAPSVLQPALEQLDELIFFPLSEAFTTVVPADNTWSPSRFPSTCVMDASQMICNTFPSDFVAACVPGTCIDAYKNKGNFFNRTAYVSELDFTNRKSVAGAYAFHECTVMEACRWPYVVENCSASVAANNYDPQSNGSCGSLIGPFLDINAGYRSHAHSPHVYTPLNTTSDVVFTLSFDLYDPLQTLYVLGGAYSLFQVVNITLVVDSESVSMPVQSMLRYSAGGSSLKIAVVDMRPLSAQLEDVPIAPGVDVTITVRGLQQGDSLVGVLAVSQAPAPTLPPVAPVVCEPPSYTDLVSPDSDVTTRDFCLFRYCQWACAVTCKDYAPQQCATVTRFGRSSARFAGNRTMEFVVHTPVVPVVVFVYMYIFNVGGCSSTWRVEAYDNTTSTWQTLGVRSSLTPPPTVIGARRQVPPSKRYRIVIDGPPCVDERIRDAYVSGFRLGSMALRVPQPQQPSLPNTLRGTFNRASTSLSANGAVRATTRVAAAVTNDALYVPTRTANNDTLVLRCGHALDCTPVGNALPRVRSPHFMLAAGSLGDDAALFASDFDEHGVDIHAWMVLSDTNEWRSVSPLPARRFGCAVAMPGQEGMFWYAGGQSNDGTRLATIVLVNAIDGTAEMTDKELKVARSLLSCAVVDSDSDPLLLFAGGITSLYGQDVVASNAVDVYHVESESFSSVALTFPTFDISIGSLLTAVFVTGGSEYAIDYSFGSRLAVDRLDVVDQTTTVSSMDKKLSLSPSFPSNRVVVSVANRFLAIVIQRSVDFNDTTAPIVDMFDFSNGDWHNHVLQSFYFQNSSEIFLSASVNGSLFFVFENGFLDSYTFVEAPPTTVAVTNSTSTGVRLTQQPMASTSSVASPPDTSLLNMESSPSSSFPAIYVVIIVVCVCMALLAIALFVFWRGKKRNQGENESGSDNNSVEMSKSSYDYAPSLPDNEIEERKPTDESVYSLPPAPAMKSSTDGLYDD